MVIVIDLLCLDCNDFLFELFMVIYIEEECKIDCLCVI